MRGLLCVVCWVLRLCDNYVVSFVLRSAVRCVLHVVHCIVVCCVVLRSMLSCCVVLSCVVHVVCRVFRVLLGLVFQF